MDDGFSETKSPRGGKRVNVHAMITQYTVHYTYCAVMYCCCCLYSTSRCVCWNIAWCLLQLSIGMAVTSKVTGVGLG